MSAVVSQTQHKTTVDRIAGWIVDGRYAPGGTLPTEPELGAALGVSRTVVREAVKALAAKGMVVARPRTGTRVRPETDWHLFDPSVVAWTLRRPVDRALVRDLVEIRLAIEPFAARLAADRRSPADLAALGHAFEAMREAIADGARDRYHDADLAFHSALIRASGNRFLIQMAPIVEAILDTSFTLSTETIEEASGSLPDHRTLLDAIQAGDGDGAQRHLTRIIESARVDILAHLDVQSRQSAASRRECA